MPKPAKNSPGQVPTSSSKNRFANKRTALIAAIAACNYISSNVDSFVD